MNNLKHKILSAFLRIYTNPRRNRSSRDEGSVGNNLPASIIISTFEKRFFDFTLPLLKSIRTSTDIPIVVVINGNFIESRDGKTYQDFVIATQAHENVSIVTFRTFRGWASLLNAGILHSDSDISIVLNDDIYWNPSGFSLELEEVVRDVTEQRLILLNNSWSHFAITKECLKAIGFFDEHFLGIGEEDGDYAQRFRAHYGVDVPAKIIQGLLNFVDQSRDETVAVTNGKYSLFNSVYLKFKGRLLDEAKENPEISTEGTLVSIYSWRSALLETLSWKEEHDVGLEMQKNRILMKSIKSRVE